MILKRDNVERIVNSNQDAERLKKEGFKPISEPEYEKKVPEGKTEKSLDEMTVAELHEVAKAKGITGYSSLNKEELLAALKGA